MVEAGGRAVATGRCRTRRTPRGPRTTAVRIHDGRSAAAGSPRQRGRASRSRSTGAILPMAPHASASITTSCSRETGGRMVSAHAMPARSGADRAVSAFGVVIVGVVIAILTTRGGAGRHERSHQSCRSCRADAGCLASHRHGASHPSPASRPACQVVGHRAAFDPRHALVFPRFAHRVPASSDPVARRRQHAARHAVRQKRQAMAPRDAPRHAACMSATARACGLSRQFSTIYCAWRIATGIVCFRKSGKAYKVFPGASNIYLWISFPIARLTYYEH